MTQTLTTEKNEDVAFIFLKSDALRIFKDALSAELARVPDSVRSKIMLILLDASSTSYTALVRAGSIQTLVDTVFNRNELRDFILNLTSRFKLELLFSNVKFEAIENYLAQALIFKDQNGVTSLIPEAIQSNLEITQPTKMFKNNDWLVVYLLAVMYINYV